MGTRGVNVTLRPNIPTVHFRPLTMFVYVYIFSNTNISLSAPLPLERETRDRT